MRRIAGLIDPCEGFDFLLRALFTNKTVFSRFTLCFLGLALCVFTWGLEYKLSLYDPPQASSHEIPSAKLLSKNEQSATAKSALLEKSGVSIKAMPMTTLFTLFLSFVLAAQFMGFPAPIRSIWDARRPKRPHAPGSLNAFFFRPPPISASF